MSSVTGLKMTTLVTVWPVIMTNEALYANKNLTHLKQSLLK